MSMKIIITYKTWTRISSFIFEGIGLETLPESAQCTLKCMSELFFGSE